MRFRYFRCGCLFSPTSITARIQGSQSQRTSSASESAWIATVSRSACGRAASCRTSTACRQRTSIGFAGEPEGAGFEIPANVKLTLANADVEQLLLDGKIDAIIAPNVPKSFRAGDPRIKRLFPRSREAIQDYFDKTRIFPITHTVVVREDLLLKEPWIVESLVDGFEEANRICASEYDYPKRLSFPTAALILEEEESEIRQEPLATRTRSQRTHILDEFMEYAAAQGYTGRRLSLGESFWSESNLVAASGKHVRVWLRLFDRALRAGLVASSGRNFRREWTRIGSAHRLTLASLDQLPDLGQGVR